MLDNMEMDIDHLDKELLDTREINGDGFCTEGFMIQSANGELVFQY